MCVKHLKNIPEDNPERVEWGRGERGLCRAVPGSAEASRGSSFELLSGAEHAQIKKQHRGHRVHRLRLTNVERQLNSNKLGITTRGVDGRQAGRREGQQRLLEVRGEDLFGW